MFSELEQYITKEVSVNTTHFYYENSAYINDTKYFAS